MEYNKFLTILMVVVGYAALAVSGVMGAYFGWVQGQYMLSIILFGTYMLMYIWFWNIAPINKKTGY